MFQCDPPTPREVNFAVRSYNCCKRQLAALCGGLQIKWLCPIRCGQHRRAILLCDLPIISAQGLGKARIAQFPDSQLPVNIELRLTGQRDNPSIQLAMNAFLEIIAKELIEDQSGREKGDDR
jgi:hypothetical protein